MKVRDKSAKVGTAVVRQCAVTRERRPDVELLRFVLDSEGRVTPDIKRRLPGRGVWVTANHGVVAEAVKRGVLVRALRAGSVVRGEAAAGDRKAGTGRVARLDAPEAGVSGAERFPQTGDHSDPADLPALVETLLRRSALSALSLANKAGRVTLGFEAVARAIGAGGVAALVHAADAAEDGRRKLDRLFARGAGEGRRRPARRLGDAEAQGEDLGGENSRAPAVAGSGPEPEDGGKTDEPPTQGREQDERLIVGLFSREELSQALGRENVTHAALKQGGASANFLREALRLSRYLEPAPAKPSKRRSKQDKV